MKKVVSVVGARPNFMKVAPIHKAMKRLAPDTAHLICHTGQHYDEKMSKVFFVDLELPEPDFYLGVGGGTHATQTAKTMIEFEKIVERELPDLVVVVGDVNSTIACSLVAVKLGVRVMHVEAGLRSGDRTMPEEINRLLTDAIADYLCVSEPSGLENLAREGVPDEKVFHVGNVMIDSLTNYLPLADKSDVLENLGVDRGRYVLVTLHRPANVDDPKFLARLSQTLGRFASERKIVFPVHPRTRKNMDANGVAFPDSENLLALDPIGYVDFLALTKNAEVVVTDSGGIQEETTKLGVPCVTVRDNTERPVTVTLGTNYLVGTDLARVEERTLAILAGERKAGRVPELWDGKAAERIVEIIERVV
jgi:UDP-N-acetylglucosamine 2-epimerase (non-hydrolysing)